MIASMTNSFSKVTQDEGLRFLHSKAEIIDELEATLPGWLKARAWFPPFIHILKFHPDRSAAVYRAVYSDSAACVQCGGPGGGRRGGRGARGTVCGAGGWFASPHLGTPPALAPHSFPLLLISTYEVNLNSLWSGIGVMETNLLNAQVGPASRGRG